MNRRYAPRLPILDHRFASDPRSPLDCLHCPLPEGNRRVHITDETAEQRRAEYARRAGEKE